MTSQAPCRCVDNILITYDETKSKLLKLVLLLISNQERKKEKSIPVRVMHSTQSTIKVTLRKKIIPHLTRVTSSKNFEL